MNQNLSQAFRGDAIGGAGCAPTAMPQVARQFSDLENQVTQSIQLLDALEQRLKPVLRDEAPDAKEPENHKHPEVYLVPFADGLRRLEITASKTNARMQSILNRVEL